MSEKSGKASGSGQRKSLEEEIQQSLATRTAWADDAERAGPSSDAGTSGATTDTDSRKIILEALEKIKRKKSPKEREKKRTRSEKEPEEDRTQDKRSRPEHGRGSPQKTSAPKEQRKPKSPVRERKTRSDSSSSDDEAEEEVFVKTPERGKVMTSAAMLLDIEKLLNEMANYTKGGNKNMSKTASEYLSRRIKEVKTSVVKLGNSLDVLTEGPRKEEVRPQKTFAEAVRVQQRQETVIRVNSLKGKETPKELRAKFEACLSPRKQQLHVKRVREAKAGGLVVAVEDKRTADLIEKSIQEKKPGLKVEKLVKRKPRLIIFDVPVEDREEQVLEDFRVQNTKLSKEHFKESVKVLFKTGQRDKERRHYVVEVAPAVRKLFLTKGRLYRGYESHRVVDFVRPLRCNKCLRYGHMAKSCSEERAHCSRCGKTDHLVKDCERSSKESSCVNCLREKKPGNHSINAKRCPVYLRAVDMERRRFNLDDD
ncbi:muscle M-line assembly protein unc-89-like [Nilaparvata lugens]|uniref:muscle M-line assembly protein unc-89-like n=1 Tax=Nilaparvata lugens TaxID=108931 RepID=UPI00193E685D|nr:muscle M-line assembly protein unc-89-like [Nilaparvata lugens]